ncbi:helix-turn-helix domain-containing protein [Ectobacillus antri]|uniref:helix-turn-helix domain-containing protein n=1 Tax=Ectobacillus antri TaxID=2486280 RepID=UPI0013DDCDEA|nr:helix-turn-helix transcriptional regulator [Ectobacillus antri]
MLQRRLVHLRKLHNLKQEDVAQYLNVSRSTYTGYENEGLSHRVPNADTIKKLSELYSVSADYILGIQADDVVDQEYPDEVVEIMHRIKQLPEHQQKKLLEHLINYMKLVEPFLKD